MRRRRWVWAVGLVGAWILARWLWDDAHRETNVASLSESLYRVERVLDGAELLIQRPCGGQMEQARVRLLGVSLPVPEEEDGAGRLRERARDYVARLIEGKVVQLRTDRRQVDEDGVLLAYVYLDDALVNARLVQQGLAHVATHPGDSSSIVTQLKRAEAAARDAGRGMWN